MEPFGIGMTGLGLAGLSTLGAFGLAFRQRRRRLKASAAMPALREPRSLADRVEALGAAQAELGLRLDGLAERAGAPEERLQAMAGQLLGLIRDKNATLETALAGLDQLRARMRALEQMGEPAEARALVDGLAARLDALGAAQAAAGAATEARLAALAAAGQAEGPALAERLAGLEEKRAAAEAALTARLAPLGERLAALETAAGAERATGREALKRLEARLEAQAAEAGAAKAELAALKAEAGGVRGLGEQLTRVLGQKEALAESLVARVAGLEAALAAADPAPVLDRLADRLAALETAENPFAEISGQLTRLYAQKDATVETVFARLAPLEAKLEALDPASALDRFAERLEAMQARVAGIEAAENPFAEISGQLTRLYAQKDATVETVFARLAPLEAKLEALDPASALDRFAERLEAMQARVAGIEAAENPFAEISGQLTRLYAQKDATVETVFARLAPLEAKLEALDPASALDRFAERLEAMQARVAGIEAAENPFAEISGQLTRLYAQKDATVETVFARLAPLEAKLEALDPASALDRFAERLEAMQARVAGIEAAENPFAEISGQLTRLYAQKDATVETVFARLAPLEAKLEALDPASALDRFAERLEAMQARVSGLETAENPFAEISGQLTRLYAQKDATVETVFARLAPLEAKLEALDPASALDRFAERLEAMQARVAGIEAAENPFAEISGQLTRLYAQKDATVETVFARLAPLEAKLEALDPASALDRFAERLEAMQARVAGIEAAENPFAEISGQLTRLYAQKDATVETVFARLAPLEAKLDGIEREVGRLAPLVEDDPRAGLDGLRLRVEGLHWAQGETAAGLAALRAVAEARDGEDRPGEPAALSEIADRLTRLYAQKDAGLAAVLGRLAPLEARLAALEAAPAAAGAAGMAALLADRFAELEARLPRVGGRMPEAPASPAAAAAAELEAIWSMPGVVSLHRN